MQQKQCFKCNQVLPLERFYRHPSMADGRLNKCKSCAKRDVKANRRARIDYYRAYDQAKGSRSKLVPGRRRNQAAHSAVSYAVRTGKISKPKCCSNCGADTHLHAHHDDYSKHLQVVWLCVPCHKDRHKELGWGYVWNEGMDAAS